MVRSGSVAAQQCFSRLGRHLPMSGGAEADAGFQWRRASSNRGVYAEGATKRHHVLRNAVAAWAAAIGFAEVGNARLVARPSGRRQTSG